MSHIAVELATRDDDAALRALVARSPVPGSVSLAYEREPDYFAGCEPMGDAWQVLCARDEASNEIVGVACRAERRVFVNGRPARCSYLGQLRVDDRYRGRWLVSRGFKVLRELERERPCDVSIATVVEGSVEAEGVLLERPRRGFPGFREIGRLNTFAVAARRGGTAPRDVVAATDERLAEVATFLCDVGPSRQFFPVVEREAFADGTLPRGLAATDFLLALRRGRVRGVLAVWDQSSFKQTVVRGYRGTIRAARPLLNLAARAVGGPRLPVVGDRLSYAFASFVAVEGDDPGLYAALLDAARQEAARRGIDLLIVGHTVGDPLLGVTATRRHIVYRSSIFAISWNQEGHNARLDGRPLYLDPATL